MRIEAIVLPPFHVHRQYFPTTNRHMQFKLWTHLPNQTRQNYASKTKNPIPERTERPVSLSPQEKINAPYVDLILNEDNENISRATVV